MKIEEIEPTPNPDAMKFVLDQPITQGFMTHSFEDAESAEEVPLAKEIFEIDHVISVYFADRWITVTQDGTTDWSDLLREVADPIRDATADDARLHVSGGGEGGAADGEDDEDKPGMDDPRMPQIEEVIKEEILPFLQGDGGGLSIKGLVDNELLIQYEGACGTCPASFTGTLMAIENLLQSEVDPELNVSSVDGPPGGGGAGGGYVPSVM